jgi:hypothetical protein
MKLPRVRFTVRRMMVAVAIAALALGAEWLWNRSRYYARVAAFYTSHARSELNMARVLMGDPSALTPIYPLVLADGTSIRFDDRFDGHGPGGRFFHPHDAPALADAATAARLAASCRLRAAGYYASRLKYEQAANIPWLPVAPDPPEPGFSDKPRL